LRDNKARYRILAWIRRLSLGNFGDVKPVGDGISELRIDYGPGYRVYLLSTWQLAGAPARRRQQEDAIN
jgi:putative addiction module killer protein